MDIMIKTIGVVQVLAGVERRSKEKSKYNKGQKVVLAKLSV